MAKYYVTHCRSSITDVLKVIKNSNLTPGKIQDQSDKDSRPSNISPAEFELYNKCKEIIFTLMSENTISGNGDRFSQNDFVELIWN